jgi:hemerythrin HHE cation binding domain-containing protein
VDPFQLLKKDHKKVSDLLKRLDNTEESDTSTREELFEQVKNELELHTQIEETIFYPALKENDQTKEITLEAYEEHNAVKTLLQELEETEKDDETWGAKLTVLKENVEHHVEEEEGEMFSKAKKVLDKDERESLGDRMNEAKSQAGGEISDEDEEELTATGAVRGIPSARGSARTGGGSASSQPSRLRASNKKRSSSKKRSTKSSAGSQRSSSRGKRSSKKK